MKPWKLWWTMPLLIFVGIVGPGLAAAHADPIEPQVISYAAHNAGRVCATLDAYPTFPGITGILAGIKNETGFTGPQTAEALVLSVNAACPRHLPLLQNFADAYAPNSSQTGGAYI